MKNYYAEIELKLKAQRLWYCPSCFETSEEAIKYFQEKYGEELVAVICDDQLLVVFEKD